MKSVWIPFFALLYKEIRRFMKVLMQTVITPLINSSLYLLIFGISLGQKIQMSHGLSYLAFLIPGVVMMAVLNNAFQNSSSSIVSGKFTGEVEDLRVVPLSEQQIVWAMSCGGLVRGAVVGLVTFLVGDAFYYFANSQLMVLSHPLYLAVFLIIGGLTFSKLGICIGFWAKSFDQLSAVGAFVLLPLLYLGGVFFSIQNMHPLWQKISQFNPMLYLINGVRYGMIGLTDVPVGFSLIVSLAFLLLLHVFAIRSLRSGSYQRW